MILCSVCFTLYNYSFVVKDIKTLENCFKLKAFLEGKTWKKIGDQLENYSEHNVKTKQTWWYLQQSKIVTWYHVWLDSNYAIMLQ